MVENFGFQSQKNVMKTYILDKRGLTNVYVNRVVADDKITITPLDI